MSVSESRQLDTGARLVALAGFAAALAAMVLLLIPAAAQAKDTECVGDVGPIVIDGNVKVPNDNNCRLHGTTVLGNVKVGDDSRLTTDTAAHITGQVTGNKVRMVSILDGTTVDRDVKIKKGESTQGIRNSTVHGKVDYSESGSGVNVIGSTIDGDVHLHKNDGTLAGGPTAVTVTGNQVGGKVHLHDNNLTVDFSSNTVGAGAKVDKNTGGTTIATNVITGNLDCKNNNPPPVGGGNVVTGTKKDQCAAL